MRVAGDEERSRMTCGESQQQVILESRKPESFMTREHDREQASGLQPARPPGGRFDGDQAAHQPHHAPGTVAGNAPQQLARHDWGQAYPEVAGSGQDLRE